MINKRKKWRPIMSIKAENKTAVDWLWEQMPFEFTSSRAAFEAYQQAKELEKQQHETSFKKGFELRSYIHDSVYGGVEYWDKEPQKFDDYFSQTYGGDNG